MKSSFCTGHGCIEVFDKKHDEIVPLDYNGVEYNIVIGESAFPTQWVFTTPENFKAFIDGVKAGEFDHFVEDE